MSPLIMGVAVVVAVVAIIAFAVKEIRSRA